MLKKTDSLIYESRCSVLRVIVGVHMVLIEVAKKTTKIFLHNYKLISAFKASLCTIPWENMLNDDWNTSL